MSAWADLADRLRARYPDDWAERFQSYKDGTNQDLQRWRAIGGERYVPRPPKPWNSRPASTGQVAPRQCAADPAILARNRRIFAASQAGVPVELLMERFGLSDSAIYAVLARFGQRVSR